jgi:transformation/transcription domain-associated protein
MVALKRTASVRQQQQTNGKTLIQNEITRHPFSPGNTPDSMSSSMQAATPLSLRQPFEYLEEIVNILKTAFPLLALTMETFVDQIHTRFKATTDEDAYRFTSILLTEAITVLL